MFNAIYLARPVDIVEDSSLSTSQISLHEKVPKSEKDEYQKDQ